jgi:Kef-type K+ transport system membrane component KefB
MLSVIVAAGGGSFDLARLLADLLIVLVAAKVVGELAERARIPSVLGEIAAGVIIGPSVLGLVDLTGNRGVSIGVLAEIGVLLLLLAVGMEMDLAELGKVGRPSMLVAIIGVVAPFAAGAAVGLAFGESTETAIFFGAALTATSVGITARVFGDLRALATIEARIVLGAAVADDVLGLVILTVVTKVVTGGDVGVGLVAETLGLAVAFLLVTGVIGVFAVPKAIDVVHRRATSGATVVVAAMAITLGFAMLADAANLAFIIGAFMAGLGLGRSQHHERIARDLGAVGNIFIPVFFLQIGINADLGAMAKPSVLGLAAAMCALAIAGKLLAAVGAFGTRSDKVLIGIGMVPRGEVGLIFASIGLTTGVLNTDQYGALLIVVLVTTIITPPLLRLRLGRTGSAVDGTDSADGDDDTDGDTVAKALDAARQAVTERPADEVLDWFGAHRNDPLVWRHEHTPALVELLRLDSPRAWRLLDVTGVLERTLPEVADSMRRRRADFTDLDPLGSLTFPTVQRLHDEADALTDHTVLAALAADVCRDGDEVLALAQRLVDDTTAQQVGTLVADAHLLLAGLRDPGAFDETRVLQLATHLASTEHTRQTTQVAHALGDLPTRDREALDARVALVQAALEHPEVTGSEATNLAAARRAAAQHLLGDHEAAIDRLRFAPTPYLLAHSPEELARQAVLVEPLAPQGRVRVAVSPQPEPDQWKIDVACRDSEGLLARLTEVLAAQEFTVRGADIATWPDGAVLDSFVVASNRRPSPRELSFAFDTRLRGPLHRAPMPNLALQFDNAALPWHTSCTVTGPDQPNALQAVATALANAGVVVHSARIATVDGEIRDRFTVSDRFGRKLDESAMQRVRAALAGTARRRT